jgi:hypothetical protein
MEHPMNQFFATVLSKLEQLAKISIPKLALIVVLVALLVVWTAIGKL